MKIEQNKANFLRSQLFFFFVWVLKTNWFVFEIIKYLRFKSSTKIKCWCRLSYVSFSIFDFRILLLEQQLIIIIIIKICWLRGFPWLTFSLSLSLPLSLSLSLTHTLIIYRYRSSCPVGWGCIIHWLYFCWGKDLHSLSALDKTLSNLMIRLQ